MLNKPLSIQIRTCLLTERRMEEGPSLPPKLGLTPVAKGPAATPLTLLLPASPPRPALS